MEYIYVMVYIIVTSSDHTSELGRHYYYRVCIQLHNVQVHEFKM